MAIGTLLVGATELDVVINLVTERAKVGGGSGTELDVILDESTLAFFFF